jgi:hypothetical protein
MKQLSTFLMLLVFGMFAACTTTPDGPAPSDTFSDAGLGFNITKPSDWHFISGEMLKADRNTIRLSDAELEQLAKRNANAPLVVFTRYPEPYPTLNPSASVTLATMPMEKMPPKYALSLSIEMTKQAYPDLEIVEPVRDHEVDVIQGAYTKVKYTVTFADGQTFPTMVRMWIVPRGNIMFVIGMTSPPEGPDVSEEAFQEILKSIKITR